MIHVYTDSQQVKFWADQSQQRTGLSMLFYEDVVPWQQQSGTKIAMTELLWFDSDVQCHVQDLYHQSDLLVLFLPELVSDQLIKCMDLPGVVMFIGGVLNYSLKHAKVELCPYFFWSTTDFYRACPDILSQLTHGTGADRYFDILLGTKKMHRDLVYQQVDSEINVVKYFGHNGDRDIRCYATEQFEWPTEIIDVSSQAINTTVETVTVQGTIVSLSQIVPVHIYNQTRYTWVTESQCDDGWSFFTEKIVKPMLGKRLFIVTSGQHYLKNLRQLGFRTFDSVINEEYDSLAYWEDRVIAATSCYQDLLMQDPAQIQQKIVDVVEHNFRLITEMPWQENMINTLGEHLTLFRATEP